MCIELRLLEEKVIEILTLPPYDVKGCPMKIRVRDELARVPVQKFVRRLGRGFSLESGIEFSYIPIDPAQPGPCLLRREGPVSVGEVADSRWYF